MLIFMSNKTSKPKIITTKKACEILNCTRPWFHTKFKPKLTSLEKVGKSCVYLLSEVISLKNRDEKSKNNPYKIIT